jgi:hypothetical protein
MPKSTTDERYRSAPGIFTAILLISAGHVAYFHHWEDGTPLALDLAVTIVGAFFALLGMVGAGLELSRPCRPVTEPADRPRPLR